MNSKMSPFGIQLDFERALDLGDIVNVRWTAGSFGHYAARGEVVKINAGSIRCKILEEVKGWGDGTYPIGREIVVPRITNVQSGHMPKTWAHFNGVFPLNGSEKP